MRKRQVANESGRLQEVVSENALSVLDRRMIHAANYYLRLRPVATFNIDSKPAESPPRNLCYLPNKTHFMGSPSSIVMHARRPACRALHTYIHIYIPAYLPTYLHAYVHTYIHTYIHTYSTYIHTYMRACMHACIHTYKHTYTQRCIHECIVHLYIYIYVYMHTHPHL